MVIPNIQSILPDVQDVQITRLTAPGENYLSLVYRVDYLQSGRKRSNVAKTLPAGDNFILKMKAMSMNNEIRWYRDMVPLLKKLGRELEVDTSFYPDYIGSRLDANPVLILDNLIPLGYKNVDRYEGFDLQSAKAMLSMLAHFHALPLVIKFLKPQEFKVIRAYLESTKPTFGPGEEMKPPPDKLVYNKLLEMPEATAYKTNIAELMGQPMGPPSLIQCGEEPWLTNVHNDYWVNNVMINPQQAVKMVDFQCCTYSSFARDLVFFLLTSLQDQVQENKFDELLRFYYDELTSIFKRLKIAELELTYEQFLQEVKVAAKKCEVGHAMFFCSVIFGPKDDVKDVLAGEGDMMDHLEWVVNNMSERHKQKLLWITKLAVDKGWM